MAVNTPLSDAKLNDYDYTPRQMMAQQAQGAAAGQAGYTQQMQGDQEQSNAKLKALLQGNQNSKDLATLLALKKKGEIEPGDNAKLGDTNLATTGESKLKQTNDKNQASAIKGVFSAYDSGSKALEDKLDAGNTLLGALKSNDQTSLGVIRSSSLKLMGLNRFNEAEGQAVAGNSYKNMVQSALSKLGVPETGDGSLNDQQRSAALKFAQNAVNEAQDRHNAIKAQALAGYQASPYYDENKYKDLSSTLGAPIDQRIGKIRNDLGDFHAQALPNTPATAQAAPSKGILDSIKSAYSSILGGGQQATAAPAPATAPQQPQQGGAPDPINDYLTRMGAK